MIAQRFKRFIIVAASLYVALALTWQVLPGSLRELIQPTVHAATIVVNATDDHDDGTCGADCTLREAINAVNAGGGGDTISFSIAGSGVRTINLTSALPAITKSVTIDGTTQTGFSGTPLIELNGAGAGGANGLVVNAANVTIRSLVINRFSGYGIDLGAATPILTGNYIGTDSAGASAAPNGAGGIKANGSTGTIGISGSPRNVIAGNTGDGIDIVSGSATVQNNFIGTNVSGGAALPNSGAGIKITLGQGTIGGTGSGSRNIISGNGAEGVLITGSTTTNTIQGNYVGTDVTGAIRIANNKGGVSITSSNNNNLVGGTGAGAGNVLSGNSGSDAFGVVTNQSSNVTVQGNIIGLNAAGTAQIPNDHGGIILTGGGGNVIGGTPPGARNVVSGNSGAGLIILSDGVQVQGNYFGLNPAGNAALGNLASGVLINGADNCTIGGTTAAARNVIAGNGNGGVRIAFSADNNTVQGNYIGTDAGGTINLSNGINFAGVAILGTCINNRIGGTTAGVGNIIAFSQGPGVSVEDGSRNSILGNSIFSNSGLGIDLNADGVTANDACDADAGANNAQNAPVITSVTPGATDTTIIGTLNSTASTQFRIEFFANTSCDPAGSGEGKVFLASTNVTTDGSCAAGFNINVPNASITGPMITATATDPNNNTSEFSACAGAPSANTIQFAASTYSVGEFGPGITVTVNRSGDTTAAATVAYTTSDTAGANNCNVFNGAASSRCDYLITLGRLRFAANETSKTITIPLIDDSYGEGPETFTLTLSNPTGSTIGDPDTATITINDNESSTDPNPILQTPFFVRVHYLDFLSREPDTPGFNFWSGQIDNCSPKPQCTEVSQISVSASFFLSIEFQQTGYLVERFYKSAYGDATATSTLNGAHQLSVPVVRLLEFLGDTQRIAEGVVVLQPGWETLLENNKQAYALEFVQTTRFITAFPTSLTPTQFVDQLNANAGNALSASERTTAINLFGGAGNTTNINARAQAVRQVAENVNLSAAEYNRAFVLAEYFGYLRRNPNDAPEATLDYTGYDFWLNKLNQANGNYIQAEMVKAFLSSIEYRQRFGP
jgi:CSLREA domain-containing protein